MVSSDYSQMDRQGRTARDFLVILFRRRWIVLGVALPIVIMSIIATFKVADLYTAEAQVLIEARSVENPSFKPEIVDYDILMSTVAEIAQSIPVADKAAACLFDSLPKFHYNNSILNNVKTKEDLVGVILTGINCGQVGESNILSINFSHPYPQFALMATDAVTQAFMNYYVDSNKNPAAVAYYSDQIREVQADIDSLLDMRTTIYNKEGLKAVQENASAGIQTMHQTQYSYYQSRSRRMGMEDKYNQVMKAVAADSLYVPTTASTSETAILTRASAALEEAKRDLAKLRKSYRDSSKFVIRQLEYVEFTRKEFLRTRGDFMMNLQISFDEALAEENSLKQALDTYRAELVEYPDLGSQIERLNMQIKSRKSLLESLEMKRGEVRLKAQGDQRISSITPLNSPSIKFGVSSGKKFIYLLFAAVLAIILGLVVALMVDIQDHRIYDRRQAEKTLDLNVLGAISNEKH